MDRSEDMVTYAQEKLAPLQDLIKDQSNMRWNLRLSKEGGPNKGDIFHAKGQIKTARKNFGADAHGETIYAAIDELKAELSKKITHHKDKRITRLKRGASIAKRLLRME